MSTLSVKRRLRDFGELLPAEQKLLDEIDTGLIVEIAEDLPPADASEDRRIRSSFLRYLILGGCEEMPRRVHEKGVQLRGAYVLGDGPQKAGTRGLDLEGCRIRRDVVLVECRFDAPLLLRSTEIDSLFLNRAYIPGLRADRLEARGDVFLRGATVPDEVCLLGARVGGDLSCTEATFERPDGIALAADGLEARGNVILRGAMMCGEVRLPNARVGGDLSCTGATFERPDGVALAADGLDARGDVILRGTKVCGEVRLPNARLGGNLVCDGGTFERPGGRALNLGGIKLTGAFFFRYGADVKGALDLTNAHIGGLVDSAECWPSPGDLLLHRCRYGAFAEGPAPVYAASRLVWLARQDPSRWGADFWPQPYEQLATVLREMGHGDDARAVLIEKERLQRRARRARMGAFWRGLYAVVDGLLRVTVRYGRQPLWAFAWLAGFWLLGVGIFHDAEHNDAIKPNNAFVLRAAEWALCAHPQGVEVARTGEGRARPGQSQLACFREQPEAQRYPRFNPWIYSLDTLLPVVEMEMQTFWIPDEGANYEWAAVTRHYLWLHIAVGWALSLLAIAGFSGLVKTD